MTPPDALSSTAVALEPGAGLTAALDAERPARPSPDDRLHVVPVDDIVGSSGWLLEAIYRGVEILVALVGLTVALPVMLVEAALIRWDSPGAALFFHRRPARSTILPGRELKDRADLQPPPGGYRPDTLYYVPSYFRLVKFRTMYRDARQRFPELYDYTFGPGEFHRGYFKRGEDPRVTRIGRMLRALTVDELPNLWCVLVGDMRLVGPRPESPDVVKYYTPDEMYKFAVKPGITGLAQINGRGLLSFGETLAWDLRYVRTRNVWLDIKIILITLKYVITRHGAF